MIYNVRFELTKIMINSKLMVITSLEPNQFF